MSPEHRSSNHKLYSAAGPFTVESDGNGYLAHYRCWLTTDPEKKVCFEGNARELEAYFLAVTRTAENGTAPR